MLCRNVCTRQEHILECPGGGAIFSLCQAKLRHEIEIYWLKVTKNLEINIRFVVIQG